MKENKKRIYFILEVDFLGIIEKEIFQTEIMEKRV